MLEFYNTMNIQPTVPSGIEFKIGHDVKKIQLIFFFFFIEWKSPELGFFKTCLLIPALPLIRCAASGSHMAFLGLFHYP